MNQLDRVKLKIASVNPFAIARRNKMRKRLRNRQMTFLTPNCLGGILFHDLGLEFRSPTVNLMMTQRDFIKFVTNMDPYLKSDFSFFQNPDCSFLCARLNDIVIYFTHYTTERQAEQKWKERVKRIDYNNIFIFAQERDGLTKEEIQSLGKLNVKGIVVFTAHDYPEIPYTLYLPKYQHEHEVGNILVRNYWDDSREYEQYFDFVQWFNEADGYPYDVSPFKIGKR